MQSADRALRILSSFDGERDSLGVTEIAQELGIHKSTVSRLMAALERRGFVRRDGNRFVPGLELARLAQASRSVLAARRASPADHGAARDDDRARRSRSACAAGTASGTRRSGTTARASSGSATGRAARRRLHSSATGKALLAFSGGDVPEQLERETPKTIVDLPALERELQRTRLRGYAVIRDELEIGLSAAAAPVFDRAGACVAALAVSGPYVQACPLPGLARRAVRRRSRRADRCGRRRVRRSRNRQSPPTDVYGQRKPCVRGVASHPTTIDPARRLGASLTGGSCPVLSDMVRCDIRWLTAPDDQRSEARR